MFYFRNKESLPGGLPELYHMLVPRPVTKWTFHDWLQSVEMYSVVLQVGRAFPREAYSLPTTQMPEQNQDSG